LLFPLAVFGAVLIGFFATGLLIIQSTKEAALLRILGNTKKRVRVMFILEKFTISVIGTLLATGGLALYNMSLFTGNLRMLLFCVALYLLSCLCASIAASVSVTRKMRLELLQVKE
jgi:ABC-type lipoprotein release transport system permease subunit